MDELERIELRAALGFLAAPPRDVSKKLDLGVLDLGAAGAFSIGAYPHLLLFNRVLGLGDPGRLPEIEDWFTSRGCSFVVSVSPGAPLESFLGDRGYSPGEMYVKFRRDASKLDAPATSLRIEQLGADRWATFGRALASAFGMPAPADRLFGALCRQSGWGCFGAFDGDCCVSTALTYVEKKVGWLGAAVTQPEARGRGGQSALLAARIRWAAERGASVLALETRDQAQGEAGTSFRNVVRAGFEPAYRQRWWARS